MYQKKNDFSEDGMIGQQKANKNAAWFQQEKLNDTSKQPGRHFLTKRKTARNQRKKSKRRLLKTYQILYRYIQ